MALKAKTAAAIAAAAIAAGLAAWLLLTGRAAPGEGGDAAGAAAAAQTGEAKPRAAAKKSAKRPAARAVAAKAAAEKPAKVSGGGEWVEEDSGGEEEKDAGELAVDAFDALTDMWMEPGAVRADAAAAERFLGAFKRLPAERMDECLHRALNLVPDENVLLLAAILMDKTLPKDLLDATFGDILNRPEEVKKPLLKTIFEDKAHPCHADAAWILDVTGEAPAAADGE